MTLFVLCEQWLRKNSNQCFEDFRDDCENFEPFYYLSLEDAKDGRREFNDVGFIYEAVFEIPNYKELLKFCLSSVGENEACDFHDYLTQIVKIINRFDPDEL